MIELIAVIVLISILSVVALSRLGGMDAFEQKAFFDEVTNALRYAQKLAVSTGCNVQVSITSTSYRLQQGSSCGSLTFNRDVLKPADRTSAYRNISPPAGITIAPAPSTFVFTPQSSVTGLAGDTTFSIGSFQFTVFKTTGLVDVN